MIVCASFLKLPYFLKLLLLTIMTFVYLAFVQFVFLDYVVSHPMTTLPMSTSSSPGRGSTSRINNYTTSTWHQYHPPGILGTNPNDFYRQHYAFHRQQTSKLMKRQVVSSFSQYQTAATSNPATWSSIPPMSPMFPLSSTNHHSIINGGLDGSQVSAKPFNSSSNHRRDNLVSIKGKFFILILLYFFLVVYHSRLVSSVVLQAHIAPSFCQQHENSQYAHDMHVMFHLVS